MFKTDVYLLTILIGLGLCVFGAGILVGQHIGLSSTHGYETLVSKE